MALKAKMMDECRVRTGLVRFSFVNVFEPTSFDNQEDKKYMITLLIPKDDESGTIKAIEKAIENAKAKGVKEKWDGKLPKKLDLPLRDGTDKEDEYEGFSGCMYMNPKSKRKPAVVDKQLNPILDPEEVYSGCYGAASITLFPYKTAGNCGIGVALDNVIKLKDGESLAGAPSAQSDFEDMDTTEFEDDDDDL